METVSREWTLIRANGYEGTPIRFAFIHVIRGRALHFWTSQQRHSFFDPRAR